MTTTKSGIPTTPGEISEFSLKEHEGLPDEERPTFLIAAPSYRDRLAIKKFSNEYRRIQQRLTIAMGVHPDAVREALKEQGIPEPTKEQIKARIGEVLEQFDYKTNMTQELQEIESELQDITIEPGFVEAMLGVNGKPGCLKGWRNLRWADGREVEYDEDNYLDTLAAWDMDAMIAIAIHIYEESEISGAAVKNLKSLPS